MHSSSNHVYTGGSKSQYGLGFNVEYGDNLENHIRGALPKEATVYTAELQAIKIAVMFHFFNTKWLIV